MPELKQRTLVFLLKRSDDRIDQICLAMKKRGFGEGNWNGVGGKVELGESVEEATRREAKEEINVDVTDLNKVAEITFIYNSNHDWDQVVHAYLSEAWVGEPSESAEMKPEWFKVESIPYDKMWEDDQYWLPLVLEGKFLKATFTFSEEQKLVDKKVGVVASL